MHACTHARTHREKEKERAATFYTSELYSPVSSASRILYRCSWSEAAAAAMRERDETRRGDAIRYDTRRDETRRGPILPLRERPPLVGAVVSGRHGILLSRESRARCKLRFSAVRLGRRIARGLMAMTVVAGGGRMREGALALTCLSCVIGARAACPRITDDGIRARTSTGPGARSSRGRCRERPSRYFSPARIAADAGCCSASCDRRRQPVVGATIYLAVRVEPVRLSPTD